MDKGFGGDDSSFYRNSSNVYLKQVSRNSQKISKHVRKPGPLHTADSGQAQPQSQQPPVYNINKNDFRDLVQKLTCSPAHELVSAPTPPIPQSSPSISRLQRIRPSPLPQIGNQLLPPHLNDVVQRPAPPSVNPVAESPVSAYMRFLQNSPLWNGGAPIGQRPDAQIDVGQRVAPPQSSMPPPSESPVSAYMRFLQSSFSPSVPPPSNGVAPPQQPPLPSASSPFPVLPLSPYGSLFSPAAQFWLPQLPLSPSLPLSSPWWKSE